MRLGIAAVGIAAIFGLAGCFDVTTQNSTSAVGTTAPDQAQVQTQAASQSASQSATQAATQTATDTQTADLPAHGYVVRDVLVETPPWLPDSTTIDPAFVSELDAFAKAGPVHLILANMLMIPERMHEAGFAGRETALWYALSRTYAGWNWNPGEDGELLLLRQQGDDIVAWWQNYLDAVIGVMQTRENLSVTIISNDGEDTLGTTLGNYSYQAFPSDLHGRVSLGAVVPE